MNRDDAKCIVWGWLLKMLNYDQTVWLLGHFPVLTWFIPNSCHSTRHKRPRRALWFTKSARHVLRLVIDHISTVGLVSPFVEPLISFDHWSNRIYKPNTAPLDVDAVRIFCVHRNLRLDGLDMFAQWSQTTRWWNCCSSPTKLEKTGNAHALYRCSYVQNGSFTKRSTVGDQHRRQSAAQTPIANCKGHGWQRMAMNENEEGKRMTPFSKHPRI